LARERIKRHLHVLGHSLSDHLSLVDHSNTLPLLLLELVLYKRPAHSLLLHHNSTHRFLLRTHFSLLDHLSPPNQSVLGSLDHLLRDCDFDHLFGTFYHDCFHSGNRLGSVFGDFLFYYLLLQLDPLNNLLERSQNLLHSLPRSHLPPRLRPKSILILRMDVAVPMLMLPGVASRRLIALLRAAAATASGSAGSIARAARALATLHLPRAGATVGDRKVLVGRGVGAPPVDV
jgi:hypothetical protein